MSKPGKGKKPVKEEPQPATEDVPDGELIDELLIFRRVDDYDRLYFTPTQDQYKTLKALARERHATASIPVFYDNFDDEITVRMKCKKGGWNESSRLIPGEPYVVIAMMKTSPIKGSMKTYLQIKSVDGTLAKVKEEEEEEAEKEVEEKKQAPIKRKATPVPTAKAKPTKKPVKQQETKKDVEIEDESEMED